MKKSRYVYVYEFSPLIVFLIFGIAQISISISGFDSLELKASTSRFFRIKTRFYMYI